MRGVVQGVLVAAGIAGGLWLADQLRDSTSWLRLRLMELEDYLTETEA